MRPSRSGIGTAVIAVIVIIVIGIAAVGAYYALSGSSTSSSSSLQTTSASSSTTAASTTSSTTGAAGQFKVAIIGASASDAYFAEFFASSVQAAAVSLSTPQEKIVVTPAYSVSATDIVSVCQQYASQGYKMIVSYVDYAANYVQIAQAVPNVTFVDEYGTPNGFNASTYNYSNPEGNTYNYNATNMVGWDVNLGGAYYVAGVAAALVSHTQKLGYDTAFNIPLLAQWYNDFTSGAHSVNSSIPVYYGFTNDWTDATKGAATTDALISKGADVVASTGDTQSIGAAKEAIAKQAYGIGYPVNLNNLSASYMLGSAYFNATKLALLFLADGIHNSISGHYYSIDYSHGGDAFILNQALVSSGTITQSDMTKINAAISAINSYTTVIGFNSNFPAQPT